MNQKNSEIQKILTEKKYLEIIIVCISVILILAGTIEFIISKNKCVFFYTFISSILFLLVLLGRPKTQVSKEINAINSKYER